MLGKRARHVRVLIAADHPPPIDKIRGLVFPDFEIVGTVKRCEQALRRAFELNPDIILVEVAEAIKDRFNVVTALSHWLPHAWVILFQNGTGSYARASSTDTSTVTRGSIDVELGSNYAIAGPGCAVNGAQQSRAHPASQELSRREYEVLALLAAGYPMKEIAFRLGITYRTVTFHKYRMMERLGLRTTVGLLQYALKKGIRVAAEQPLAAAA